MINSINSHLMKVALFYSFILIESFRLSVYGVENFQHLIFNLTICKNVFCLLYGYISIIFSPNWLKNTYNTSFFTKYSSRNIWIYQSIKKILLEELSSLILIICAINISCIIYKIDIDYTKISIIYIIILFIYLLTIKYILLLLFIIFRKYEISVVTTILINTINLLLQHYYFNMYEHFIIFLCFNLLLLFVVLVAIVFLMEKSDIYTVKKLYNN